MLISPLLMVLIYCIMEKYSSSYDLFFQEITDVAPWLNMPFILSSGYLKRKVLVFLNKFPSLLYYLHSLYLCHMHIMQSFLRYS